LTIEVRTVYTRVKVELNFFLSKMWPKSYIFETSYFCFNFIYKRFTHILDNFCVQILWPAYMSNQKNLAKISWLIREYIRFVLTDLDKLYLVKLVTTFGVMLEPIFTYEIASINGKKWLENNLGFGFWFWNFEILAWIINPQKNEWSDTINVILLVRIRDTVLTSNLNGNQCDKSNSQICELYLWF
jgi:hypothetical protein